MPKKAKSEELKAHSDVIVEKTESDERSTAPALTGDESIDEVITDPSGGATLDQSDVESPIGEDKSVIESAEDNYAAEIEAEAENIEQGTLNKEQVAEEVAEEPLEEPVVEKKSRAKKKEHVQSVRQAQDLQGPRKDPHSKKYRNAVKDLDLKTSYDKTEALELVKKTSYSKFDGTVEAHIKLSVENQRAVITLPHGTGKERKVTAVTADNVEDMVKQIEAGKIDFDVLLATPDVMSKLSKVARVLGPRKLMPSPKSGTVTGDIEKAKAEFGSGRIEFKQDKGGAIHQAIGKVSMDTDKLLANLDVLLNALPANKITSVVLTPTMGPGIKVKF